MIHDRFDAITRRYATLAIGVGGDFCLDRYLEIDPAKEEISLETGLPVHNVARVRAQPGGAGTVLNNLAALGVNAIFPVGFCGEDGEGFELRRALAERSGVRLDYFLQTGERRTFTYCKPLVVEAGKPPRELNRLDQKNWTPTPAELERRLGAAMAEVIEKVDALVLLGQVDLPETGALTARVLETIGIVARQHPRKRILADSRHGLRDFPSVGFKMNASELAALDGRSAAAGIEKIKARVVEIARRTVQPVFVTLAERGIVGASPDGQSEHVAALPLRGDIDVVGAGDAVTANLIAALAAGATLRDALELANAAASVVIHQLGTTGVCTVPQLRDCLFGANS